MNDLQDEYREGSRAATFLFMAFMAAVIAVVAVVLGLLGMWAS